MVSESFTLRNSGGTCNNKDRLILSTSANPLSLEEWQAELGKWGRYLYDGSVVSQGIHPPDPEHNVIKSKEQQKHPEL